MVRRKGLSNHAGRLHSPPRTRANCRVSLAMLKRRKESMLRALATNADMHRFSATRAETIVGRAVLVSIDAAINRAAAPVDCQPRPVLPLGSAIDRVRWSPRRALPPISTMPSGGPLMPDASAKQSLGLQCHAVGALACSWVTRTVVTPFFLSTSTLIWLNKSWFSLKNFLTFSRPCPRRRSP